MTIKTLLGILLLPVLVTSAGLLVATNPPARADTIFSIPGGTNLNVPLRSYVSLKFKNVIQQSFDVSCGAAAMATLMTFYYGEKTDEQEVIKAMLELGDPEKIRKDGFSLLELKRYAENRGFMTQGFRIPDVNKLAKLKVPVITLINTRGYNHFVVLKGLDRGKVFFADPAFGNRSLSIKDFDEQWSHVILVAVSSTNGGNSVFALDGTLKAKVGQIPGLFARTLQTFAPLSALEF